MKKVFFFGFISLSVPAFALNPTSYGAGFGNVVMGSEIDAYPTFNVKYEYNPSRPNQYGNCARHGRVKYYKVSMCGLDGKAIEKTGCQDCLRAQHDDNVRKLKAKAEEAKQKRARAEATARKKAEAEEVARNQTQNTSANTSNHLIDEEKKKEEELEYERGIVSSLTITNGETLFFDSSILDLLPFSTKEFEIFQFAK